MADLASAVRQGLGFNPGSTPFAMETPQWPTVDVPAESTPCSASALVAMLSLAIAPGVVSAASRCSYFVNGFRDDVTVQAGEVACGGAGDDVIGAIANGGTFRGGAGNDQVRFGVAEGGTFIGNDGNDSTEFLSGTFNGGAGNDGVIRGHGVFNGGPGDDGDVFVFGTFNGGDGNDSAHIVYGTFNGGGGSDSTDIVYGIFNGGAGADTGTVVGGTFNGGDGNDTAPFVDAGTFNGGDGQRHGGVHERSVCDRLPARRERRRWQGHGRVDDRRDVQRGNGKDVVVSYTGGTLISVP